MQSESDHPSSIIHRPSPGARDLYILTLGLLAGLVLGPWVLGRVHPPTYHRLFTGLSVEVQQRVIEARSEHAAQRERLTATGVTDVEVERLDEQHQRQVERILAEMAQAVEVRLRRLQRVLSALVVAVLAVMVVEAVVPDRLRGGLATARYALLAVWVAIGLAQLSLLAQVPVALTLGLIAVALLAALVPLGRRA